MVRYLSLFSGCEAASLAWEPLGWEPVAFSEIEPAACAVLGHRYPHVPNLGDVRGITREILEPLGRIDLVVFGFPCTDLSVAGKRAGLKDQDGNLTRSGLFYEATRIVRLCAEHHGCRWLVAENVPGLYSSHHGRDFAEVLREITGLDVPVPREGWRNSGVAAAERGWSLCWCCLDSQHFGVPQRRRRVFLVGHLGDWRYPAQVLLEPESLSGNPPPSREARKDVARSVERSTGGCSVTGDVAHTLKADGFDGSEDGTGRGIPLVTQAYGGNDTRGSIGVAAALNANATGRFDFTVETLLTVTHAPDVAFGLQASVGRTEDGPRVGNAWNTTYVAQTLQASDGGASNGYVPVIPIQNATRGQDQNGLGIGEPGDPMYTLDNGSQHAVAGRIGVRRLTPMECERLQGMPDGHTTARYRGKPLADGPRYKMIGNSMAVPCMRWIGQRLQSVHQAILEMPSRN